MLRIISEWTLDTDEELCNFLKHSQKEVYYFCIKLFNSLSLYINKAANNVKQFRMALCIFLFLDPSIFLTNILIKEFIEDVCCYVVIIYFTAYICCNILLHFISYMII
jgi:hypothetical protein